MHPRQWQENMIFFAFQKSGSNRTNSITKIENIDIKRVEDLILVDIKATGFLYGMVRLIVGQLVLVGEKKYRQKFLQIDG